MVHAATGAGEARAAIIEGIVCNEFFSQHFGLAISGRFAGRRAESPRHPSLRALLPGWCGHLPENRIQTGKTVGADLQRRGDRQAGVDSRSATQIFTGMRFREIRSC